MSYTSTAITAQGSKLEIATGTGGAVSITSVSATYPWVLTKNGHGLSNGDVVTCAAFAGADADHVNSLNFVVSHVTTNTFALDVDALTYTITIGSGTCTPVTYTEIKEIKSYSGFDGEASEVDVTHVQSAAKEFILGLRDYGSFNADISWLANDTGQNALRTSADAGTSKAYKLTLSNAKVASFTAYAKSVPISGGVDKAVDGSFKLKISGVVTWA